MAVAFRHKIVVMDRDEDIVPDLLKPHTPHLLPNRNLLPNIFAIKSFFLTPLKVLNGHLRDECLGIRPVA
jgi:hypothetical protein